MPFGIFFLADSFMLEGFQLVVLSHGCGSHSPLPALHTCLPVYPQEAGLASVLNGTNLQGELN